MDTPGPAAVVVEEPLAAPVAAKAPRTLSAAAAMWQDIPAVVTDLETDWGGGFRVRKVCRFSIFLSLKLFFSAKF